MCIENANQLEYLPAYRMVYGTWYIYTTWCRFLCVELLLNFVQRCKMQKLEKCNKNNENENENGR